MKLDVSTSGALAASLDKCIVSSRKLQEFNSDANILPQDPAEPAFNTLSALWRHDACSLPSTFVLEV